MPFVLEARHIDSLPQEKVLKPLVLRQLLHAWRLGITHPRTGEKMTWEARLPEDFQAVVEYMKFLAKS